MKDFLVQFRALSEIERTAGAYRELIYGDAKSVASLGSWFENQGSFSIGGRPVKINIAPSGVSYLAFVSFVDGIITLNVNESILNDEKIDEPRSRHILAHELGISYCTITMQKITLSLVKRP